MAGTGTTSDGTRLVRGLRWLTLGRSPRVAWGTCRGSAAEPYRTVVSARHPDTTSCTCPSRRRPCKHAIGLAELAADQQIAGIEEPDWVRRLAERPPFRESPEPTSDRGESARGPVDTEAAARRAEARRAKVTAGFRELQVWLADQVRTGLAQLPRAGYGHFDAIAARMVDAQAPAVAGTLRSLPADLVSADWPGRALHVLGGLHLLAEAHDRLEDLPDELAATVRSRVGYPVAKDVVRSRPALVDRWWAIAAVDTVEYQLTSRRVWLRGLETGRWALWLTFAPPGRDLDTSVQPGRVYACAARFYPGSGQHRVLIEPPLPDPELPAADAERIDELAQERSWAGDDLQGIRVQLAELLAADPWASRLPVVVAGTPVPPVAPGEPWQLRDPTGATVPLADLAGDLWPVVAQSGGDPLQVMGEFDGHDLLPLAVVPDDRGRRYTTTLVG
ncbi:MAG TPA: SWIM zinc finger family protein [Microlunatus sp.]|nr:SWIM zinc finger family protein [Microlunatus sp.]